MKTMKRRDFIGTGVVGAIATAGTTPAVATATTNTQNLTFKNDYAPHFGMFRNHAATDLDELKFMADQGFRSLEDNGMAGRSVADQEKFGKEMQRLGMRMGVFVVNGATSWIPSIATGKQDMLDKFLLECKTSVDVAKRVNAKWMTVVPGQLVHNLEMGYQTAHVIDALRRASEIFEPHGLVMVLEALNPWRDHPQQFLSKIPQGFAICRGVNSPSCKILFDRYHQQITEGNIIPNIDLAYSEVAYYQIGDNPGRNEPTSGEMNYKNIFKHIHGKGFKGVLGMEHGNSKKGKEGELALIKAYRDVDSF